MLHTASAPPCSGKLGGRSRQCLHIREPLPCGAHGDGVVVIQATIPSLSATASNGAAGSALPLQLPLDAPLGRAIQILQDTHRAAPSGTKGAVPNGMAASASAASTAAVVC